MIKLIALLMTLFVMTSAWLDEKNGYRYLCLFTYDSAN